MNTKVLRWLPAVCLAATTLAATTFTPGVSRLADVRASADYHARRSGLHKAQKLTEITTNLASSLAFRY